MEKQRIKALLEELGLGVKFEFVPWERSRSAKPNPKLGDYNLNYKATVLCRGRELMTTDYSMGQGHCPAYKKRKFAQGFGRISVDDANAIMFECKTGRERRGVGSIDMPGKPILPDPIDFFYCIVSDCDVLYYASYEEWGPAMGYDPDSRKGEQIYRECLKHALALNSAIGGRNIERLREAFQDY